MLSFGLMKDGLVCLGADYGARSNLVGWVCVCVCVNWQRANLRVCILRKPGPIQLWFSLGNFCSGMSLCNTYLH